MRRAGCHGNATREVTREAVPGGGGRQGSSQPVSGPSPGPAAGTAVSFEVGSVGEALHSFVSSAVQTGQVLPVLRGMGRGAEVGLEQPGELRCLLQVADTELSFRFSFPPV